MPFIEIITDLKSQAQLSKIINKESVNNCEIMYIREKNIENIKNIRLDTLVLNQTIDKIEIIQKIVNNTKNLVLNIDLNENNFEDVNLISFGYNSKSDITISSIEEDEVLICIQNTITSIYGRKIEPQEIKVNVKSDINVYNIMIIIALTALYAR